MGEKDRGKLTNGSARNVKLSMVAWIVLLNVATTSMRHRLGDVRESGGVMKSFGVSGIEELLEVIHHEVLLFESRPVRLKYSFSFSMWRKYVRLNAIAL
jgi:hypothetical protein